MQPADQAARDAALDPGRSFIVRAPAGSGKTGLLTQRFLKLLTRVEHPEQVLAITFTRKAAAEMQQRIIGALNAAAGDPEPAGLEPFERTTHGLAREVLAHSDAQGWRLREAPYRLKVMTIDALAAGIVARAPLAPELPPVYPVTEDARELYLEAVRNALTDVLGDQALRPAFEVVMEALDNDVRQAEARLVKMLETRDQWLHARAGLAARADFDSTLSRLVEAEVEAFLALIDAPTAEALAACLSYAGGELRARDPAHPCAALAELARLPEPGDAAAWRLVADVMSTVKGELRRSVNKNTGFPTEAESTRPDAAAAMKTTMTGLLADLAGTPAARALLRLRMLPDPAVSDDDWRLLEALRDLLKVAAASLAVVFEERQQMDFVAMQLAANSALGDPALPSEFALTLDHRVQHLLVDEFQDTSAAQYTLLRRLTQGWDATGPRSLFFVGDPLQSIYRFRQAEVVLFLRTFAQRRFGSVPLETLALTVNFRSRQPLVAWLNAAADCFQGEDNSRAAGPRAAGSRAAGAWPELAPGWVDAVAARGAGTGPAVSWHAFPPDGDAAEAASVVALVSEALAGGPRTRVGILARARAHLRPVARALTDAGIPWRGVDIESLDMRPAVSDVLALARALLQPYDRVAWLAVMRAPWCGIRLADLTRLAGAAAPGEPAGTLWQALRAAPELAGLSADGCSRAAYLVAALGDAVAARGRRPLGYRVRSALAGLADGTDVVVPAEQEFVEAFLALLESPDFDESRATPASLTRLASERFATPKASADTRVELMTVHKAKGLEFDCVILPGIARVPRQPEKPLVAWHEFPFADDMRLLAAGLTRDKRRETSLYDFIWRAEAEEYAREDRRLLYVALTRARERLCLLAAPPPASGGGTRADPRSFLGMLWPQAEAPFSAALADADDRSSAVPDTPAPDAPGIGTDRSPSPVGSGLASRPTILRRLRAEDLAARCADLAEPAAAAAAARPVGEDPEFAWAGKSARVIGTIVHGLLEFIGRQGIERVDEARVLTRVAGIVPDLELAGLVGGELEEAAESIRTAMHNVFADPKARWILSGAHAGIRNEWRLSAWTDASGNASGGRLDNVIIDRSFVDEDGTRWIVDYKTALHRGGASEDFLAREEERYAPQLEAYARVVGRLETRPLRLGLYFPFLRSWRWWQPGGGRAA